MTTVAKALSSASASLSAAGIDEARLDAEVLLAHALGLGRSALFARLRDPLDGAAATRFEALLERRRGREPVAYIVGGREFWSLWFEVSRHTLVPRPETEGVVEIALESVADLRSPRVLDIGTGSGCIAVAIAAERPDARITAIDVSGEALDVARRNAERLGVGERIALLAADLRSFAPERRFDLVVANPPYIRRDTVPGLQPEVALFEPRGALDGGPDGLELIARILERSRDLLEPGGRFVVEIGADQADAAITLARRAGLDEIDVRPDAAGLPRVLVASTPVADVAFTSPQPPVPSL